MKNILLILLLLSFQLIFSQRINYNLIAEYQVQWQPDSTNISSKRTVESYLLFSGNKRSIFLSSNRLALDTIVYRNVNITDLQKLMSMPKPTSNKRIIKDKTINTNTIYDEISSTLFKYGENLSLNWILSKDTIIRNNIVLKKATTRFAGRDYIAWYNDKIPNADGPYKFKGLPGLIFKIYDNKKHFTYEILNYKIYPKSKVIEIDYIPNSKETTKRKFKEAQNEFVINPIPLMESEGAVFSEETKRIIRQKFKKRNKLNNNPIELNEND